MTNLVCWFPFVILQSQIGPCSVLVCEPDDIAYEGQCYHFEMHSTNYDTHKTRVVDTFGSDAAMASLTTAAEAR